VEEPLAEASPAVSDHSYSLEVKAITSPAMKRKARTGVRIIVVVVIRIVVLDQIVALEMDTALVTISIEDLLVVEAVRMECNLTKNRNRDPHTRLDLTKTAFLVVNFTSRDSCREFQDLEVVIPIAQDSSSEGARGWVDPASPKAGTRNYLLF